MALFRMLIDLNVWHRIIKRAIRNVHMNNFPEKIYPKEIVTYIRSLHSIIYNVIKGDYDRCVFTDREKEELQFFKQNYRRTARKSKYYDIGFEDYFYLHFLACRKLNIKNPDRFDYQQAIRLFFLDSIYNNGRVNEVHKNFPNTFIEWVKEFDNIFTTNYDKNLEIATLKDIYYLHGAFHIKKDIYKEDSFRNRISDSPIKTAVVIDGYDHLYSTALTTNSGVAKELLAKNHSNANSAVEKMAKGYKNNPDIKKSVDSWKDDENMIIRNLYESIMLKVENPELTFNDYYPLDKLNNIEDVLTIVGLSPNNDTHLFDIIAKNNMITEIVFYYFSQEEKEVIKTYFSDKHVKLLSVKELWNSF